MLSSPLCSRTSSLFQHEFFTVHQKEDVKSLVLIKDGCNRIKIK